MTPLARRLLALLIVLAAASARAADPPAADVFKDWIVGCDNTRHCEAVGYEAEDAARDGVVALWIGRDAGPGAPVQARIGVGSGDKDDPPEGAALEIVVGKGAALAARNRRPLPPEVVAALLPRLLDASTAQVRAGKARFTLSLAGAKAALLKIDDRQGRVDTPGALVRKGTKPESTALPPLPAPHVALVALPGDRPADPALEAALRKAMPADSCQGEDTDPMALESLDLRRLDAHRLLVLRRCNGGYNADTELWIARDHAPFDLARAEDAALPGAPAADDTGAAIDGPLLRSGFKGRGIGDCGTRYARGWTGHAFALVEMTDAPLCRGLWAGEFNVRLWTATH